MYHNVLKYTIYTDEILCFCVTLNTKYCVNKSFLKKCYSVVKFLCYNHCMKKFAIYTLGCKTNQYESQMLAELMKKKGWEEAPEDAPVDAYIVNSCTVTAMADRKSRQYIRRMKRENPEAVVALIGCYPQTHPEDAKAIEEVDIILGTQNKQKVADLIEEAIDAGPEGRKTAVSAEAFRQPGLEFPSEYCDHDPIFGSESRTRALIKIQEGCNRFCSYCVIPYARGPVHSRPLESVVKEAEGLVAAGFKEIVLTGINTALYGSDWPGVEISGIDAVVDAISSIPGDFRIRLGSLEPTVVNAEYVKKLFRYDKLCHHLHLSVQSGSDAVISAMNRHYTAAEYMDIVNALREFDPDYGITTDIIVGFPGESEEDLAASMKLAEEVRYLKVHCFPYSVRPFTRAALMDSQIPMDVKRERNLRLIEFADRVSLEFRAGLEGSRQRILVEEEAKIGSKAYWKGHASNFCPVYLPKEGDADLRNEFVNVIAGRPVRDGVYGRKE